MLKIFKPKPFPDNRALELSTLLFREGIDGASLVYQQSIAAELEISGNYETKQYLIKITLPATGAFSTGTYDNPIDGVLDCLTRLFEERNIPDED